MSSHNFLRESVSLTLIQGEEKIDRSAIIRALGDLIPVSEIDSLGNIGNFNEWFVILKTCSAREGLLKFHQLAVGNQLFGISEPYQHTKLIRLMNIPPTVSDADIRNITSKWGGNILTIDNEKLPHLYEGIKTFVRRIRIRFSCQQDEQNIPFSIRYNGLNIIVYLEGRKKVCYRCKQTGHVQAECSIPKCRNCHVVGHDDPSCRLRHTYATAVLSTPNNQPITPALNEPSGWNASDVASNQQKTSAIRQERIKKCYICDKVGHLRRDYPERDIVTIQSNEPVDNREENKLEEEHIELSSSDDDQHDESETIMTMNDWNDLEVSSSDSEPPIEIQSTIDETLNPIGIADIPQVNQGNDTTDHRESYDKYKNPKRGLADRSLDSEPDIMIKKTNVNGLSSSTLEANEDSEIENQR